MILHEHQQEIAAIARRQDVLLSAPQQIGKTFIAAHVVRECLLSASAAAVAASTTSGSGGSGTIALAVAPTQRERAELYSELARACGVPVLLCGDPESAVDDTQQSQVAAATTTTADKRWESDAEYAKQQLTACIERHGQVVVVLAPSTLLFLLRKRTFSINVVTAIVVEDTEQVHMDAPAFFRTLVELVGAVPESQRPRLLATTRARASSLDFSAASRNALYARIRVLTVVPAVDATQLGSAPSRFPLLLCEPFDPIGAAHTAPNSSPSAPTTTINESADSYKVDVAMREFLYGANNKQIDYVRILRLELELGNSAATYDERKRQDRINRFVADAESVYAHLGYWCLLKYIELELQANLQACLVDDDQNVNNRKKRLRDAAAGNGTNQTELEDGEEREVVESDSDDDTVDDSSNACAETVGTTTAERLSALVASQLALDDAKRQQVSSIVKLITWLSKQTAAKIGTHVATPRLLKTAHVVRSRLLSASRTTKRVWVFLERRAHCRVVSEYLTACLADLALPPSCCMLGTSHARIAGALQFSSNLKVMTMFESLATNVMVTTSIAKASKKNRVALPLCDLVVVMDELLEADKLFAFSKRAHPVTGVVKYVTPNTGASMRKFNALVDKMREYVQLDDEQSAAADAAAQLSVANASDPSGSIDSSSVAADVAAILNSDQPKRDLHGRLHVVPRVAPKAVNPYEIVHSDTGAVLNAGNAVACLSRFCDSLPGLDTFDKRAQYVVTRYPIPSTMSNTTKQCRKKRLKYNAKIHDAIDDCRAEADAKRNAVEDETAVTEDSGFEYAATLKLPLSLGIKKKLTSHKVASADEAKGIVAFKACQELLKKGLLDRSFRSKLIDDLAATIHRDTSSSSDKRDATSGNEPDGAMDDTVIINADDDSSSSNNNGKLRDLSTQNSYDLPPVSAAELSLRPIRTLLRETQAASSAGSSSSNSVTMCFYGLTGVRFAILATNELYTGSTNVGWRYDFATSDVMAPAIHPVTLAKTAVRVQLTTAELQSALHFHLVIMRLACMGVQDAMRDVDIASDDVWNEFSEQNDKGYLVVPSVVVDATTGSCAIDWAYVHDILGKPLLEPMWPLPDTSEYPMDEWICVPTARRNVTYVVEGLSSETVVAMKAAFADKEAWNKHIKEAKSTRGNPILGRWYTSEQILQADEDQPLIYGIQVPPIVPIIRRVLQRNNAEGSIAISSTKYNERLLLPECTSRLRLTKTRFFDAIGIVPVLNEFERKCQMSHLMSHIGVELDMRLLDDATSKPAYERLEILGDTFLKLETTWFMYETRRDIAQEGELTRLRRDIIRNDRLCAFALAAKLQHYILYPSQMEQHPFEFWKPSCMGKTPKAVVAPTKWIADVLEAICGAYVLGHGERGARSFLSWIGVSVPASPSTFAQPYYPDCFPCELYDDLDVSMDGSGNGSKTDPLALGFTIARFDDLPQRLVWLQQRLKYTFKNKRLLLEAVTHPSAGHLELLAVPSPGQKTPQRKEYWRGDYERLEYLGDAIIEYLTLAYAFVRFDTWLPGSLSQWKSATVSNDALGKTALACFGVDECICAGAVRMDRETLDIVARIERTYVVHATGSNCTDSTSAAAAASRSTRSSMSFSATPMARKKVKATGTNPIALPKMFADVFEALVAAVFLDSGHDLQTTRDVFLGPLLATVGQDALAYVCRESGLTIEHFDDDAAGSNDQDAIMHSLLSDDDDDDENYNFV